jgi:hypothetical protein
MSEINYDLFDELISNLVRDCKDTLLVDKVVAECKKILIAKGREYQNNKPNEDINIFGNFDRAATKLKSTPEEILLVYMLKHVDSICTFCSDLRDKSLSEIESKLSEPIEGRFTDLLNYVFLLRAMIERRRIREKDNQGTFIELGTK